MVNMGIESSPLRTVTNYSVSNEDKKAEHKGIISNMANVSNAGPECTLKPKESIVQENIEHKLTRLVGRYKIKSINIMNDKINSLYSKLPEGVAKEDKYLRMLVAQKNVLSNWKQDFEKNPSDLRIKIRNITSSINVINKQMVWANAANQKGLLAKKKNLLSEKQTLLSTQPNDCIAAMKDNHRLNKIINELTMLEYDIASQSKRLAYLKSST